MVVDETVTYLEMNSRDSLVPPISPSVNFDVEMVGTHKLPLLKEVYARIGAPHNWTDRPIWSDEKWRQWLSRQGLQPWIVRASDKTVGLIELEIQAGGDVEIVVLGMVPELTGKGLGGHLLTQATVMAWNANGADEPTKRVWLHTSSLDHPRALPNYQRRGFRIFKTEQKQRII